MDSNPFKILFLDHFNRHGGAQEYALDLARALQESGHEVFVANSDLSSLGSRRTGLKGTGFTLLSRSYLSFGFYSRMLTGIRRLRTFIEREDIGILHCNSLPVLVMARLLKGRRRIVFTCHDFLTNPFKLFLVAHCPDIIVSVSESIRASLLAKGISLPNVTIHNGFHDEAADTFPLKPHAPPRIGLIGRLVPWKGCSLFLEAASALRAQGVEADFRLIGSFENEAYRAVVLAQAEAAGVRWLPFMEDKRALYRELDVVVNASIEPEPFGRTLAEAAMFGLPSVGPDRAGPSEIVQDGITGLLFTSRSAGALAEALKRLALDLELRQRLGCEARAQFLERFSITSIAARVVQEAYYGLLTDARI